MMVGEEYKTSLVDGRATYFDGGWKAVTERIVTRRHYDLDRAKQIALKASGLANDNGSH